MREVAALFVRKDSAYKAIAGVDAWDVNTIEIDQWHWGHVANKPTWLYIVGCDEENLPLRPHTPGKSKRVISTGHGLREGDPGWRSRVTQKEREYTPPALATWLVRVARQCSVAKIQEPA